MGRRDQANDASADLVAWNADYAEAMRDVSGAHPDDPASRRCWPSRC
jgi:hypothetical protein